jgi:putative alpha-1,2-mannosidase
MARSRLSSPLTCLAVLVSTIQYSDAQNATNILSFVDPLIGTINGGHVFAGASLPFSMAKAVADTDGDELQGGYASDGSNITGFSHLHDSGTGGVSYVFSFCLGWVGVGILGGGLMVSWRDGCLVIGLLSLVTIGGAVLADYDLG